MIASGYTLSLYCDCRQCRKSPNTVLRFTGEFVADTPDCRKQCFAQARRAGATASAMRLATHETTNSKKPGAQMRKMK